MRQPTRGSKVPQTMTGWFFWKISSSWANLLKKRALKADNINKEEVICCKRKMMQKQSWK